MRGNSQNGGQTTKSLLIKPQCSGVPIQQAVSLSSSFPRHCLLFCLRFFPQNAGRRKVGGTALVPGLLHTKPPRLPSRKPGRFVCFRGAFSGAHTKPCEGSFGKPRVCGEKWIVSLMLVFMPGSPPHVRGKACGNVCHWHRHGIIPAFAGKRIRVSKTDGRAWDHPRVCGERAT